MEVVYKYKLDKYNSLVVFEDGRVVFQQPKYNRAVILKSEAAQELKEVLCQYLT